MQGTTQKIRVAIFASGSGTNAENCIRYFAQHNVVEIAIIITNNPEAGVIQRAEKYHLPVHIYDKSAWQQPEKIIAELQKVKIEFIVLAGYLKLLPKELTAAFPQRIINIHPALLPKYGGKGMYGNRVHEAVIASQEKETGITIHYVNEEYDKGDIIFQKSFPITSNDNAKAITKKVHALEYAYLPKVIEKLCGEIAMEQ